MPRPRRVVVGTVGEIPEGGRKLVSVEGREIGVFHVNGRYYAVRNRCPHQGGPLCLGPTTGLVTSAAPGSYGYEREGEILRCPWHGWEFDLRDGHAIVDPARTRVKSYPVVVVPAAETYPVEIEQAALAVVIE